MIQFEGTKDLIFDEFIPVRCCMSSFALKLLAMITMTLDHAGAILFPSNEILRLVGRLSFPIYCFLLSEGFVHTSSRKRYLFRMGLWGVISEPVFDLAFRGNLWVPNHQNVFFTLFFGLCSLWLLTHFEKEKPAAAVGFLLLPIFAAEWFHTDYGAFGAALIVVFYICRNQRVEALTGFALLNTGFSLLSSRIQLAAAAAVLPLAFYNGKRGPKLPGWIFYAFYPAHLLVLWGLHTMMI